MRQLRTVSILAAFLALLPSWSTAAQMRPSGMPAGVVQISPCVGHEHYLVQHYDLHAYYVPHSLHEAYCPNGIPSPEAHSR